jgi:transcriptional regulator with GAF, ATPase, and Fis domain
MTPLRDTIADVEKRLILEALKSAGWVQARAARSLGITQRILGYKIKKYGIRTKTTKQTKGGKKDEKISQNY